MAHLFPFDPEIATPQERKEFFEFLIATGKLQVEIKEPPQTVGGFKIVGRIFERIPFEVWGFEKEYAILQALREYRSTLTTLGKFMTAEVEVFKKSQGGE